MKAAYFKSGTESIIFIQPFGWNNLSSILKNKTKCKLELLVGYKSEETFYVDKHNRSHALRELKNDFMLQDAFKLIKRYKISVYEFQLSTERVKIMSTISGGVFMKGSEETIDQICTQLRISSTIKNMAQNKLLDIDKTNSTVIGEFMDTNSLLEYLYDEAMEVTSPGYSYVDRLF